jgi:hypothetical protein
MHCIGERGEVLLPVLLSKKIMETVGMFLVSQDVTCT